MWADYLYAKKMIVKFFELISSDTFKIDNSMMLFGRRYLKIGHKTGSSLRKSTSTI